MTAIKVESRVYFRALGKYIEERRKEIGVTQSELAKAIGVSQQTAYAIEVGERRVSVPVLLKLAKFFEVPVEELATMSRTRRLATCRLSPAGMRHANRYQQLRRPDQRFVKKIIDVLLRPVQ